MPPIPHIAVTGEVAEQERPAVPAAVPIWKKPAVQIGALAAVLVLGAGLYFGVPLYKKLTAPPPPPPVVAKPKPAAPAPATVANLPAVANKPAAPPPAPAAAPGPALSDTQAAIAHAPLNAINKAKDVIAKREGSGQGRDAVGAITDGDTPPPAGKPAPKVSEGASNIAPGISATNGNVESVADASVAFRTFIANAKITGVVAQQGRTPLMVINNRLTRAGDTVDAALAITFEGLDFDRKLIIFKDKTGAVVTRRY